MAILKQHRKRTTKRDATFDAKCITRQYKDGLILRIRRQEGATLKNGVLLNKIDNVYYGFITRNPQLEDLKYVRSANILLTNFYDHHKTQKPKYYLIDKTIMTKKEFASYIDNVNFNCVGCNKKIELSCKHNIKKKDLVCSNCNVNNISKETLIEGLNKFYNIIKNKTLDNIKIIHDYQSRNLNK